MVDIDRLDHWCNVLIALGFTTLLVVSWVESPSGQLTLAQWRARAANCAGCRRRKERLAKLTGDRHFLRRFRHVLFDASQIVDGGYVETVPDPEIDQ